MCLSTHAESLVPSGTCSKGRRSAAWVTRAPQGWLGGGIQRGRVPVPWRRTQGRRASVRVGERIGAEWPIGR